MLVEIRSKRCRGEQRLSQPEECDQQGGQEGERGVLHGGGVAEYAEYSTIKKERRRHFSHMLDVKTKILRTDPQLSTCM